MNMLFFVGWTIVLVGAFVRATDRWIVPRLVVRRRVRSAATRPSRSGAWRWGRVPIVSAFVDVAAAVRARAAARNHGALGAAALPLAVDLVAVAARAGLTPLQAIAVAAQWSPQPVAAALDAVQRAVALGATTDDALHRAAVADPVVAPLVDVLAPAVRVGAPLARVLPTLAADLRAAHARDATARARRVSVHLIFPLVLLVLPAFALLTVVPALVAGWRSV